ncbi:MAG: hypothetical protein JWQ14_2007 [Adhaeribacter sp.]|nr:hypothetical protein [Adhaeribacter sp.]
MYIYILLNLMYKKVIHIDKNWQKKVPFWSVVRCWSQQKTNFSEWHLIKLPTQAGISRC